MTNYYTAKRLGDDLYKGLVYTHSEDGNREVELWHSAKKYNTEAQAIDAAAEWCEDNDVEAELE